MVYNPNIPQSTDNLSVSQGDLLGNFTAIDSSSYGFPREHVSMTDTSSGGLHKKVTFATQNTPGAQTDPSSAVYTAAGTASSVSQLFYKNQNATYHLSPIKAWAFCNGIAGGIRNSQSSNVTSVTRTGVGQYTVVLPANTVGSANYGILFGSSQASSGTSPDQLSITYTIVSATSFTVKVVNVANNSVIDLTSFTFMVLQI